MSALLPDYTTPDALADHLDVSPRFMRELVRSMGSYSLFGKKMIMFDDDVDDLLEATRPCHSKSTSAASSGTTGVPQPEGDYEALRKQRTNKPRKGSRRKPKPVHGNVILMARGQT